VVADRAFWRPSTGDWWFDASGRPLRQQWGYPDDIPVAGDYDGDKLTDVAVWRPSTGEWWIINSSKAVVTKQFDDYDSFAFGWEAVTRKQWGQSGDIPVPADYDGDGRTDFAVWTQVTGKLQVVSSYSRSVTTQWLGGSGYVPVPADYDGDGRTDFAVRTAGEWKIVYSSTGNLITTGWCCADQLPVPGDYDHDGRADLAEWTSYLGHGDWLVQLSSTGSFPGPYPYYWGMPGDVPIKPGLMFR